MQSFFPSSLIAYSWSYTLPNFAQRHLQKCAVKNLRGIVLMDGAAVIHQSFSTTVLPSSFRHVCSKNEQTVYSVCVFDLTACCWKEVGGSHTERHKYGSWRRVLHRKETSRMKRTSRGTDLLSPVLAISSLPPPPPSFPVLSLISLWRWPHSTEAAMGWMASRLAVMLLKARGLAMSQLWGDRALPLPGCHVGPVT